MEFKGLLKERQPWVKIVIIIAAGYMMYLSFEMGQYIYAMLAAVVVLAVFFKKEHVISKEGVDIRYELFGIKSLNRWEWNEISAIKTDYEKAYPNVLIHIGKDVSIRDYVMKKSDIPGIIELARRMNPDIYIGHMTEEEREKRDQQVLRQQEIEKGIKAAKKRKR
ncbi:MAG: hypothetical protein IJB73_03305 [Firmicutes bacterium]|nr:hypothetical protein [Bacillota bacterium]